MVVIRTDSKSKIKGQMVQKIEWKQAEEQTDTTDYNTLPASAGW